MSDLVKKYWWVLLALAVLVAVKIFWPEAEKPAPVEPETVPQRVEEEKPATAPVQAQKPMKPPVENVVPQEEEVEDEVQEIYPEEEEVQEAPNFVLCEYIVSGETQYEFTGEIRLINKGNKTVNGWYVEWEFEDGSTIIDSSGVALAGNNPYTGQYLPSNAEIAPGETVTFSFTGIKGGDRAPLGVEIEGKSCM